jgi:hypothetical protein
MYRAVEIVTIPDVFSATSLVIAALSLIVSWKGLRHSRKAQQLVVEQWQQEGPIVRVETFSAVAVSTLIAPMVGVRAVNEGRGSVSVDRVTLELPDKRTLVLSAGGPSLPYRLDGHSSAQWVYWVDQIVDVLDRTADPAVPVRGLVELGNKEVVRARESIKLSDLALYQAQ